ncbi:hypothetical protein ABK040_005266 [Willaertia magna]
MFAPIDLMVMSILFTLTFTTILMFGSKEESIEDKRERKWIEEQLNLYSNLYYREVTTIESKVSTSNKYDKIQSYCSCNCHIDSLKDIQELRDYLLEYKFP